MDVWTVRSKSTLNRERGWCCFASDLRLFLKRAVNGFSFEISLLLSSILHGMVGGCHHSIGERVFPDGKDPLPTGISGWDVRAHHTRFDQLEVKSEDPYAILFP